MSDLTPYYGSIVVNRGQVRAFAMQGRRIFMMCTFPNGFPCRYPCSRPFLSCLHIPKNPDNSKDGRICPSQFSFGGVLLGENTYLHLTIKNSALYTCRNIQRRLLETNGVLQIDNSLFRCQPVLLLTELFTS